MFFDDEMNDGVAADAGASTNDNQPQATEEVSTPEGAEVSTPEEATGENPEA